MTRRDSLAKNTLLLSIGAFLTKGLSFVMVPFFSRWLSTSDYGTYDLLATYVTLLLPIIGLASNEALFRFSMDTNDENEKKKYVSNCFAIFTINSFIFFLIMFFVRCYVGWDLALYFFVLAIGEVYNLHLRGYLRAIKRLDVYSFVNAITTVFIAFFTTIFVKLFGLGLRGMILGYGVGYLSGDVIIVIWTKYWKYLSFRIISPKGMKKLIDYSYALIPNSLAWWFINVSDRTIINMFLGAVSNGIYAIAYKIPNILTSVFSVFSVSWQQSATEAISDSNRNEYYNKVFNQMTTVLIGICCGVLSLNFLFFNYIFDSRYYEGFRYAPILIAGTVFATISQFYGSIQISFKQPKENGVSTVIGAVSNLVIHLSLIKVMGLYAAAISTLMSQFIVCIIRHIRLKKYVSIKMNVKTVLYFAVYVYFTFMAYIIDNVAINIINFVLASVVFLISNKAIIIKILKKTTHLHGN